MDVRTQLGWVSLVQIAQVEGHQSLAMQTCVLLTFALLVEFISPKEAVDGQVKVRVASGSIFGLVKLGLEVFLDCKLLEIKGLEAKDVGQAETMKLLRIEVRVANAKTYFV